MHSNLSNFYNFAKYSGITLVVQIWKQKIVGDSTHNIKLWTHQFCYIMPYCTLDGAEENRKVVKATTAVDENDDNAAFEGFISDENPILF